MPKEMWIEQAASIGSSTTQVRITGRGEANREFLICFSRGSHVARATTDGNGNFDVICAPGTVNDCFTARHFESNGTMGDNQGWSNWVMNPLSPDFR